MVLTRYQIRAIILNARPLHKPFPPPLRSPPSEACVSHIFPILVSKSVAPAAHIISATSRLRAILSTFRMSISHGINIFQTPLKLTGVCPPSLSENPTPRNRNPRRTNRAPSSTQWSATLPSKTLIAEGCRFRGLNHTTNLCHPPGTLGEVFPHSSTPNPERVRNSSGNRIIPPDANPSVRPRHRNRLLVSSNSARRLVPPRLTKRQRLFPRRPHSPVVGASVLHRSNRNLDADNHRHACNRLRRQHDLPAAGLRLSGRPRTDRHLAATRIFSRRIFYSLRPDRKAIRRANARGCGDNFLGDARNRRRRPRSGDRAGSERGPGDIGTLSGNGGHRANDRLHARRERNRKQSSGPTSRNFFCT